MLRRTSLLLVAVTVSRAHAAPVMVAGQVEATTSRWSGDTIVSESKVTVAGGQVIDVVQLGGVVDGIGMSFSHQPALLHSGEAIELELAPGSTQVIRVQRVSSAAAPAVPGVATYGVQRTSRSKLPLWRPTGCLDMIYDTTTVSSQIADVLDASFGAWATATDECAGVSFASERKPNVATAVDKLSTVHVRSDRWCRPANGSEPELCYAPDAAAVTRLIYVDNPGAANDGKIIEADMELNAVNFALLLPGETAPATTTRPALDLQSIVTHEAGHVLGLAHDCGTGLEPWPTDRDGRAVPACDGLAPDSGVLAATMYYKLQPGESRARVGASDAAGACAIAPEQACERYVVGGCAAGGGASGLAAIAIPLIAVRRRRRRSMLA